LRSCDGSPSATPSVDANKTGWLRDYETTCTIRARSFRTVKSPKTRPQARIYWRRWLAAAAWVCASASSFHLWSAHKFNTSDVLPASYAACFFVWHLFRAWKQKRARTAAHRVARGACHHCGYSLVGNVSGVCPECGTPVPLCHRKGVPEYLGRSQKQIVV
jgi:uncharacterized paraquat-inducible protein A